MNITYYFLAITVTLALFQRKPAVTYVAITACIIASLTQHIITVNGLVYVAILTAIAIWYFNRAIYDVKLQTPLFVLLSIVIGYFALHFVPGFTSQLATAPIIISAAHRACKIWLNFDKVIAALIIYTASGLIIEQRAPDWPAMKQSLLIWFACVLIWTRAEVSEIIALHHVPIV